MKSNFSGWFHKDLYANTSPIIEESLLKINPFFKSYLIAILLRRTISFHLAGSNEKSLSCTLL